MATEVKRRRGTTVEHSTFTGAVAELTVDLTKDTVVVHDGATQAGFPLLREDFSNAIFTVPDARYLLESNNLSDLDNVSTARDNLELGASDDVTFNTVTADLIGDVTGNVTGDVTGDLTGAIHVQGKNDTGGTLTKGTPVYISGQVAQGQQFTIGVADSDGSGTMPSIGVLSADVNDNAMGDIVTHGKLIGIDTSSFTVGDELFIGPSGTLVNTPPTGESNLIQKIAKVIRVDGSSGQIYIMGAGRTNAVPNLDEGDIFIGDSNNQAITKALSDTAVINELESDVIENHLEIESLQDNKVEKGQLFPDGDEQALGTGDAVNFSTVNTGQGDNELYAMNQNVRTTDAVTFSTVDTGQGANELYAMNQDVETTDAVTFATVNTGQGDNELYAMNQDVQTTDDVTFNVIDVTDKVESASGFTSGILGAGTKYDMDDGNGSFFEVDNMRIRNELRAHIFKKDIVKASNAYLFITDSAEIATTTTITDDTSTFRVVEDGTNASFNHQDLLWAKNLQDDGSLQATGVKLNVMVQPQFVWDKSAQEWDDTSSIPFTGYTEFTSGTDATSGKNFTEYNVYAVENSGTLNAGDTIVRVSGGNILNDASSQYSPFIDIYDGVTEWSHFQDVSKTKVRLGNLEGVSNTSGYGLFTENAFLTGSLVVGDLTKAGNYLEYTGSTMNVVTDTFTLDAGTIDIDSSGVGSIALGAVPPTSHSSGAGVFFDGDGNALIGDNAGSYLKFDSTNGIQIQLSGEEDDLSTAVAELRSDLIDIHLSNESSFSGIQFLSGQLVLKAGTGNSIASITLDGTQEDISTISLDADFIIVTGTTIFKSAKDGSTTPTNLGEATFIDGGTIVTDSITATEINVSNLFAQEIEVTGKLKATDGSNEAIVGKLENIDINVQAAQGGVSNGDFYGFFINANNYFGISDGDLESGNVLKVGDATNFLEFDGTNFTINASTFDLTAGSMTIDSTDGITIGANDFFKQDKTFSFGGGVLSGDSDTVLITTTNFNVNTDNQNIVIGTGSALMTVGKLSSVEQGIKIDSGGITNQNYWKLGQGDVQFKVGDGTNFLSFNENAGTFEIKSEVFDLESGNLHIDSDGTTYPSASSSTADSTSDKSAWSNSSWTSDNFAINDKTTVKFQFDYDITSSGEILIALYTSTNGTTFTAYSQSDTTAVINLLPEFADNSKSFATTGSPPAEKPGFQFSINNKINNRIDALDGENPSGGRYRTGTVSLYLYIADIGDASHIRFEVFETTTSLPVCNATNIITQEFQSVTELNPSGVFTRLSDAIILANGDKYLNPELIT